MNACPPDDAVEIHVFGPGYGECLLVHLGLGEWMVVDSCKTGHGSPSALVWLAEIGVDPAQGVKLVVATHWHDDHVRGLAETFAACKSATFVCSNALLTKNLLTLTTDTERSNLRSSGVDELREVVSELRRRKAESSARLLGIGYEFASANKLILRREVEPRCEVWSLSPSTAEIHASLRQFAEALGQQGDCSARRRVMPCKPNNTAVALWLIVGGRALLLGADLEEWRSSRGKPARDAGWSAIVGSSGRPTTSAEVYKVAHHGSATAHNDEIWSKLLDEKPIALVTPFRNGKVGLPTGDDRRRILGLAGQAYISARSDRRRYRTDDKVVAWAMHGKNPTTSPTPGHIWMRASANPSTDDWAVMLQNGACSLNQFAGP
ncbi:MBL fold metallo-hydrolase [Myxococcota bacterium]